MAEIISIANPKGGVGKTTTAINLAASLAIAEKKVLLIDLDPNGSLTAGLGMKRIQNKAGMYEIFSRTFELSETIHSYPLLKMDVIPCFPHHSEQESRLNQLAKNRGSLKRKFNDATLKGKLDYDFILIDTPPSLSDITLAALAASSSVLIPMQCGYFALEVIERLLRVIKRLKTSINPQLRVEGILLNYFDRGTRESHRAAKATRRIFKGMVLNTVIPKNTALGFAAFEQKPLVLVEAIATGATAYLQLAKEILERHDTRKNAAATSFTLAEDDRKYSILEN